MKTKEILEKLTALGLTEMRIAEELGICQSSINKIKRGVIKNPAIGTSRGIEMLYHRTLSQKIESYGKD